MPTPQYFCGITNKASREVKIPDGVRVIADGVFQLQNDLFAVKCPDSLEYIGSGAFADCRYLLDVETNSSLVHIWEDALKNSPYAAISGIPGTVAEQYAQENRIPFRDISYLSAGKNMSLDDTKDGWYFGNSGAVFGGDYYLTDADRQYLADHGISTKYNDKEWSGSCFGLAATVILAKNGQIPLDALQNGAETLSEIEPTPAVQSLINYYQAMSSSKEYLMSAANAKKETTAQRFWRMLHTAENIPNGESPFLIDFSTGSGFHAVVGYGVESGNWTYNDRTYDGRILIWDSNAPDRLHDDFCLYFDYATLDYCIPYYNVRYSSTNTADNRGGITHFCNDVSVLNAYPYPFEQYYDKGDLNLDGTVSVADAVLLSRYLSTQAKLSGSQLLLADLSGDGKVNAVDLSLLKRMLFS